MSSIGIRLFRLMNQGHVWMYSRSKGRLGSMGGKVIVLVTTGRKTGRTRQTPLMHLRDGDRYLITATAGGSPTHPAWYLNLSANPEVEIRDRDHLLAMRARETEGDERAGLWNRFVEADARFAKYVNRTTRTIPVIVLEPR